MTIFTLKKKPINRRQYIYIYITKKTQREKHAQDRDTDAGQSEVLGVAGGHEVSQRGSGERCDDCGSGELWKAHLADGTTLGMSCETDG